MRTSSADGRCEKRQGTPVCKCGALLIVSRAVPAVEAVICTGIDVDAHALASGEGVLDRLDRRGRNVSIVAGKMEHDRTFDLSGLLQLGMDAAAVIAHRCVHPGI